MNQEPSLQAQYLYRPENLRLARTALAFLVFGGIFFYFIYSPALNIPFAYHDHYRFFREDFHAPTDLRKERLNDYEYKFIKGIGRPIAAEIEYNMFKNVTVIKDLVFFRHVTVILIVMSCTVIALWLYYLGLPKYLAFLISGSLFTLPGIQNFVCMANMPNVLTIILATVASLLLYRLRYLSIATFSREGALKVAATLVLSFVVLLAALFNYPILACLFLLPPLTLILFRRLEEWSETRRVAAMHIGMLGFTSIVYLIVVKFSLSPTLGDVPGSYQVGFTTNLAGKMRWFTTSVSVWALNLWNV